MLTDSELQDILIDNLDQTILDLNDALRGNQLNDFSDVLIRLGRDNQLPHWFAQLENQGTLPNLDGKTIGSVLEMLLVAILQKKTFSSVDNVPELTINPAKGVDLPEIGLGLKSPSENYCTSEPFFSAYERLLGNTHDALIILTDYQTAKTSPPLQLQIIKYKYLRGTEIADLNLCAIARKQRSFLLDQNEAWTKKFFRFLSYVNQADWRAKRLLKIAENIHDESLIKTQVARAEKDFEAKNVSRLKQSKPLMSDTDLAAITGILNVEPLIVGVIDAIDNWVVDIHKDFGRLPNDNEWDRLKNGPLNGKIGMSFALQWRYNFGKIFS